MDDVHHHDGRDDQRQRGDGDLHDPLGRPRPLRPPHRAAHDAPAGASGQRRPPGSSPAGASSSGVDRRRRRSSVVVGSSGAVVGASTTATGVVVGRRRRLVALGRSRHRDRNDASRDRPRSGRSPHGEQQPGRVERDVGRRSTSRGGRSPCRQAPATRPKTNRPGYSTGRKWMSANHAATASQATTSVDAGGERALQQPAVDELLDDRRADADHQHEQHHRRRRSARSTSSSAVSDRRSSENVSGHSSRSGRYTSGTQHELGEHADRHADEVDRRGTRSP